MSNKSKEQGNMRTIQPLSPDLQAPNTPRRPNPRSVYPVAAYDPRRSDIPMPHSSRPSSDDRLVKIIVIIVGVIIVALSVYGVLAWLNIIKSSQVSILGVKINAPFVYTVTAVAFGCNALAGIGIIFRREMARLIFIFTALSVLGLTLYHTHTNWAGIQSFYRLRQSALHETSPAVVQKRIEGYKNDSNLSASEKTELIAEAKQSRQRVQRALSTYQNHVILPLAAGYVVTILPMAVLLPARVRDIFD